MPGSKPAKALNPIVAILLDTLMVVTIIPLAVVAIQLSYLAWLGYHPKRRPVRQTPESFGLPAKEVTVAGADDLPIACWLIESEHPSDVVVVVGHGMGRHSGSMLPMAKALHDAGYHVLTFDLRNHGRTPDDRLLRGQSPRYGTDHHNVVKYARDSAGLGEVKVACLGVSMSAWTALECARKEPDTVRAVICDSGPTLDVVATTRRMFEATRGALPRHMRGPLMGRIAGWWFTRSAMFFLKPAPWPMELGDHSIRVLFIGGEKDPVARPEDLREQLKWYPRAESWFVPNAGHANAAIVAADEYVKRVLALLADAFPRQRTGWR